MQENWKKTLLGVIDKVVLAVLAIIAIFFLVSMVSKKHKTGNVQAIKSDIDSIRIKEARFQHVETPVTSDSLTAAVDGFRLDSLVYVPKNDLFPVSGNRGPWCCNISRCSRPKA